jgi:hypothetical protein
LRTSVEEFDVEVQVLAWAQAAVEAGGVVAVKVVTSAVWMVRPRLACGRPVEGDQSRGLGTWGIVQNGIAYVEGVLASDEVHHDSLVVGMKIGAEVLIGEPAVVSFRTVVGLLLRAV